MADVLVPIAISSQLDITGEERVHAAKYDVVTRNTFVLPYDYIVLGTYIDGTQSPSTDWRFVTPYRIKPTVETLTVDQQPPSVGRGMSMSSDATYIACPHDAYPYITVYQRSGDTYNKMTTPISTTSASTGYGSAFSPDDTTLFVGYRGGGSSAHVIAYELVSGVWTEVAALLQANLTTGVTTPSTPVMISCTSDNALVSVAFGDSGLRVFNYTGTGFTDATATLSPAMTDTVYYATWKDSYLALRTGGSPNADSFSMYQRVGAAINQVATLSTTQLDVDAGAWSPDGAKFIGKYGGSLAGTFVGIYDFDGSALTLNSTITIPLIDFNPQNIDGIVATTDTVYISTDEPTSNTFAVRAYSLADGTAIPAKDLTIPTSPTTGMFYAPSQRSLAIGRT